MGRIPSRLQEEIQASRFTLSTRVFPQAEQTEVLRGQLSLQPCSGHAALSALRGQVAVSHSRHGTAFRN